jgi:hypothetical protein
MSGALRVSVVSSSSSSAGWPGLLIAGRHTTEGAPSFAQFAKGEYHERMRNRICAEEQELRRQPPTPSTTSGKALAKNARMGHPQ